MIIEYDKLVRDFIPDIIVKSGKVCETRILAPGEYMRALRAKLREEVDEYLESGELEELADIMELLRALAEAAGETPERLEEARAQKANARGGFAKRIFLVNVDDGK